MTGTFTKGKKEQLKARVGLAGPTGGGKTYSALVFATALVENTGGGIAVIDTENGRALTYADEFEFDHINLQPPYSPQRYADLIQAAAQEGYEVVLIDSLSHAWSDEGGVLDIKDKATERSRDKNSFAAWRYATPEHNKLVNALVHSPIHVVATMRSKMAYVIEEVDGKNKVRKVGLQPVQREGMEYEFDVVCDIDLEHMIIVSKSRCKDLADAVIRNPNHDPTETFRAARAFRDWLNSGEPPKLLPWLDDLCERFGEGETLDAINDFRVQGGADPLISVTQVTDVPPDRVELLASYLHDKYPDVPRTETVPTEGTPGEAPPSEGGPADSPSEPSVAGGGDGTGDSAGEAHGSDDPSSRDGQPGSDPSTSDEDGKPEPDPNAALERAHKAAAKKKSRSASKKAQATLGEGEDDAARSGDDPGARRDADESPSPGDKETVGA